MHGKNLSSAAITAVYQAALNQLLESVRMEIITVGRRANWALPAHTMSGQGLHNTGCGVWNDPRRIHVVNA
jgi:hypothetical protein